MAERDGDDILIDVVDNDKFNRMFIDLMRAPIQPAELFRGPIYNGALPDPTNFLAATIFAVRSSRFESSGCMCRSRRQSMVC